MMEEKHLCVLSQAKEELKKTNMILERHGEISGRDEVGVRA